MKNEEQSKEQQQRRTKEDKYKTKMKNKEHEK